MDSKIIGIAIDAHHKTNHLYDGKPYSLHLALVASYAQKFLYIIRNKEVHDDIMGASWLHDVIEDARLTYNDVIAISNERIANIVYALTNEKGKNRKERANDKYYQGIKDEPYARFVKLCDRLANAKYSVDTNSRMASVYKKENQEFIDSLFNIGSVYSPDYIYNPMIVELNDILRDENMKK